MHHIVLRLAAFLIVAVVLAACAGNQELSLRDSGLQLQGRTVAKVVKPAPKMIIMTPGKSLISSDGILGTLAVYGASDDLGKEFGIANPAQKIADALAQDLQARGVQIIPTAAQADLILETEVAGWRVNYQSPLGGSYAPNMVLSVKLKDRRNGKVLASAKCENYSAKTPKRSYEDILGNNGALLKQDIAVLTQLCLAEIRNKFL